MPRGERTVEDWFDLLKDGLEYRCQYGQEDKWRRVEEMFYNGHPSMTSGPNIIYSTGDAILASVHVPNPYIIKEPRRPEQIEWAPLVEGMDNDLVCQMRMKDEVATCGLYTYLWGTSVLKIGYDSEFGWDPRFDAQGMAQPVGASLSAFGSHQNRIEYSDNRPGMPWVRACLPHDIVVPWGTRGLDNCPWIAHRIVRHIDDIKEDVKYTNKRSLAPQMSMKDFVESYMNIAKPYRIGPDLLSTSTEGTGEAEYVEMWEIHDKETHKVFVIATNHNKFLRNDINHLQIRGLPFVELGFVPKGRTFWRTSDAMFLMNHQAELTDITIQARKQRRLNILKYLAKRGAFKDEEMRKLLSRDIGAVAIVEATGSPLQDAFMQVPASNSNQGLYMEAEDVRGSARETVGFDRNSYGEYKGARTTATEVEAVQQSKSMRMGRRENAVADMYTLAIEKVEGICFKFWTTPKVMSVMGPLGVMQWYNFVPKELAGDYSTKVVFDDPTQDTVQNRQMLAFQMYQASMSDPSIDPILVRRNLARAFPSSAVGGVFLPGIISPMGPGLPGQTTPGVQQGGGGSRPQPTRKPSPAGAR